MKITGTISIDGIPHQISIQQGGSFPNAQTSFVAPGGGLTTTPQSPRAAPGGPIPKTVRLVAYEMKAGVSKTTAKPYRLHKFTSSDCESFATFKADIAATLQQAVNAGPVSIFVTRDRQDRGWTVEFIALQQPGAAPAAVKPTPSEDNDDPEYGEP
jgi:hypothetical protein